MLWDEGARFLPVLKEFEDETWIEAIGGLRSISEVTAHMEAGGGHPDK